MFIFISLKSFVSTGLSFLDPKATGVCAGTFISYEAMLWMRRTCSKQVQSNAEALQVLQVCKCAGACV